MKKNMIISLVVAFILSIASSVIAAPAQTFSDVPAKHWAYPAVAELARVGIIDGYGDGAFRGDKTMTRYEMSQIVSKAMANSNKATAAQKALIDKLAVEFAMELNKLTDRVTKLEKDQPVLTFKGSYGVSYKVKHHNSEGDSSEGSYSLKLEGKAKVDKATSFDFRFANPAPTANKFKASTSTKFGDMSDNAIKLDRVSATTKVGSLDITLGRQALVVDPEDFFIDSSFFSYDGAKVVWEMGKVNADLTHGRFAKKVTGYPFNGQVANDYSNLDVNGLNLSGESGKANWAAGWASFTNNLSATSNGKKKLLNYYYGQADWAFNDKFTLGTEIGKNTEAVTGGQFWSVKGIYGAQKLNAKGKENLKVQYINVDKNTIATAYTGMEALDEGISDAFTTLDITFSHAFSKNMVGKIERTYITDKDNDKKSYDFWKAKFTYKF